MSTDPKDPQQASVDDAWAEALAEQADAGAAPEAAAGAGGDGTDYAKADFDSLEDAPADAGGRGGFELGGEDGLDVILDIPVTVSMEIGRTRLPIRNLLRLNQGSVIELDRLAGEPLDVLVNGTLIAHGEVVVVNEKYGIRLTDVISPAERVRKLK